MPSLKPSSVTGPRVAQQSDQTSDAGEVAPPQAVAGESYVTRKGDTLWRMAEQAYGDGSKWPLIADANKDRVRIPDPKTAIIGTGVKFEIPAAPQGGSGRERVTGGWQARERVTGNRERVTGARERVTQPQVAPKQAAPVKPQVDGKKASEDATSLYTAMKGGLLGAGTDEDAIFKTLEGKSPEQLAATKAAYKDHYGRDLDYDLKDELSGKDLARAQSLMKGDAGAADATAIKQALGTLWNDNDGVYRALENKSPQQLQALKDSWLRQNGEPLEKALQRHMTGDKLARAQALLNGNPVGAEAARLSQAMRGAGTDEAAVMSVLSNKTPAEIGALRAEFKKQGRNLDLELEHELSGAELKQAKALLGGTAAEPERKTGSRLAEKASADPAAAERAAKNRARADAAILENAFGTFTNDNAAIERALTGKSPAELKLLDEAYEASTGKSLEVTLRENMSGPKLQHAMELLRGDGSAPAAQLHAAMAGAGTDEDKIKLQLQGRSKKEIAEISADYQARYGKNLASELEGELSGRDLFDVKNMMKGVPERPSEALALLNERHRYEREGWKNAVAGAAIDTVSDSGKLLDTTVDRANAFYRNAMAENRGEGLTQAQEAELGKLIGYGVGDVQGYRDARDTAGEVAANVATTAAAVGVTVATAGAGAVAVAGYAAAAAGTARVVAKGTFAGESYTMGSAATDAAIGGVEGALNAASLGGAGAMSAASRAGTAAGQAVTSAAEKVLGKQAAVTAGKMAGRVVAGSTEGAITGSLAGTVSGAAGAAVNDKTWTDGVASGLGHVAMGSLQGAATGAVVGSAVGGAMNVTGHHVHVDEPRPSAGVLRNELDAAARKDPVLQDAIAKAKAKLAARGVKSESAALTNELDAAAKNDPMLQEVIARAKKRMDVEKAFGPKSHAEMQKELDEVFGAKPTAAHLKRQKELEEVFGKKSPAQIRQDVDRAFAGAEAKVPSGAQVLSDVQKLRLKSGAFKPESDEELSLMRRAVAELRGASGRLKPENLQEAQLGRDLLKFFHSNGSTEDIAKIVGGLKRGVNEFMPSTKTELALMRKAYDKLKGSVDPEHGVLAKQLGHYFNAKQALMDEVHGLRDKAGKFDLHKLGTQELTKVRDAAGHLSQFGASNELEKALEIDLTRALTRQGSHVDLTHVALMLKGHEHAEGHEGGEGETVEQQALLGKTLEVLKHDGPANAEEAALMQELQEQFGDTSGRRRVTGSRPAVVAAAGVAGALGATAAAVGASQNVGEVFASTRKNMDALEQQLRGLSPPQRTQLFEALADGDSPPRGLEGAARQASKTMLDMRQQLGALAPEQRANVEKLLEQEDARWPLSNQALEALTGAVQGEAAREAAAPRLSEAVAAARRDGMLEVSELGTVLRSMSADMKSARTAEQVNATASAAMQQLQGLLSSTAIPPEQAPAFQQAMGALQEIARRGSPPELIDQLGRQLEQLPPMRGGGAGLPQAPLAPRLYQAVGSTVQDGTMELRELASVLRALSQDVKAQGNRDPQGTYQQASALMMYLTQNARIAPGQEQAFQLASNELGRLTQTNGAGPNDIERLAQAIEQGRFGR